ncbi:NAD(P)H-hydrate dehydratase [Bdellovibrio svalbardensis]|uniref:ADP-dependent (S)-NAD(P)H-hydrate dehydratase n=1 Tax=Bdellovibrio svalbardensis TaxID=2972972 RepID=A0ABT6DJ57_9BACT|nr:NAD(P)H-hydrate dehydratase [Bdellovibrio svalbardensis]MDG0816892.1 NAD(P)H-hydrate dehydratase [Bdellovibrio svalbardensis]
MKKSDSVVNFGRKSAGRLLPAVSTRDNKARRGRSLLLAGSHNYPGAGVLAARAALRMGSGYVILAQPNIAVSSLENPDFLLCDLNDKRWEELKFDAILVGPGFGVNEFTASVIRRLKELQFEKVILDADALTVCAQENLFPLPRTWIVTPHTGELARCLKVTSEDIDQDREHFVKLAQEKFQCVVLLKGHGTLIRRSARTYKILSGNSALAKAGTGDVLAGMITALRAQGLRPARAALLGAYLHGACADLWVAKGRDSLSLMASDVIEILPEVIHRVRKG